MQVSCENSQLDQPTLSRPELGDVVVIQMARLGDFLQSTPLLAALSCSGPRTRVTAVVTPAQAPLARGSVFVHRVAVVDPDSLWDLTDPDQPRHLRLARARGLMGPVWESPADDVCNLNLSPLGEAVAAGWPRACRHGWRLDRDGRAWLGEPWTRFVMALVADRRLTRLHLCDLLASYADPAGPPIPSLDYQADLASRDWAARTLPVGRPQVVLQLGANNDLRRWPVASFAALARGLMAEGAFLILVGSARERVLARRLMRELGGGAPAVRDLTGRTDLAALAAVLEAGDLVVSGDTGTLHLATAVGARVLALFMGPAQVHETGPYGMGHLVLQARDACGPCQEQAPACGGKAPCRALLRPETVLAAAKGLLAGRTAEAAVAGLELPGGVEAHAGLMDGYGQRYRPLRAVPLGREQALAMALREAGRTLTRSAYASDDRAVAEELTGEWLPAAEPAALEALAAAVRRLSGAAAGCDAGAARRIAAQTPGLEPLAGLVGPEAPPRLVEACRTAANVLEVAVGSNS